ncbi:MAG: efflux RND transporter permease subunit [Defluviitaleaceae bacterium]|nr:efflux RND transporter permease subunit [Defluviitaleaceae bacterium]
MIKLTETIVKRPIAAIVIIAAVIVFGIISVITMPQEITPDMDMPMLVISTVYPGAGPGDVENLISDVIKNAISTERGVRSITSQSMENVSIIIMQFEFGHDIDRAYTHVSRSIDGILHRLPGDALAPIIMAVDINAMATMTLSIHSESHENLLHYVEDEIVPLLSRLSSVASIDVRGGTENYIRVEVIEEALREHGLTIHNVIQAMAGVGHTAPIGTATFGDIDLGVRIEVQHETIEALRRIPITLRTGDVIRVSDVANIFMSETDATSISRFNGNETISIDIFNPQAITANRTSADVTRVIDSIMATASDVHIEVVHDSSVFIANTLNSVAQTLLLAIGLSMIILYLFLGDIRACLIVGSSMPISLLVTFIFMDFMGFSLNLVTMSGLIIGVGMMVDNAIVVIDSCFRFRTGSKSFAESAIEGTKFVMLSIFAVTLTTVVVFVPLATIDGMAGQLFGPLGFSIVFALVASLISAVTLVPLFFVQFKPIERKNAPVTKIFAKMENGYARLLGFVLKKKKSVVAITAIIMAVAVFLATFMNFELMPAIDEGMVIISVDTRPGLNLERVDAILSELEEIVSAHPDVSHFMLTSGGGGGGGMMLGGGGFGGSSSLTAYLRSGRQMQTDEVIEQWRHETAHILDIDINIAQGDSFGMGGADGIGITLVGYTLDGIREGSEIVENLMRSHGDIIRVSSSIGRVSPQAEIVVDPLMAASHGINPMMVTGSIFTALNGAEAAEMTLDGQLYSIRVEYTRGRHESISDISNMMIMSGMGALVSLSDIATIEFTDTPQTITRQDGLYTVTVTGIPTAAARFSAQRELLEQMEYIELPEDVRMGLGIMDEMQNEELAALGIAIITAILLVFMVMSIQFESIRHSIMVMTCIPLAVIGSLLLMFLTGTTISMVSMLGFLVLIGLVVNNGILFVDTANQYRETMELHEALIHTGRTRLRPILMITLTTVLALIPLALGFGDDMMQGLGVTVIGGLFASTTLALIFLPTFYLIIDGNPEKRAANKKRRTERREEKIKPHI